MNYVTVCAHQVINKRLLSTLEAIQDVRNEVEVMHHLAGHPNVVTLEQVGGHDVGQGQQGATAVAAGAGFEGGDLDPCL